MNLNLYDSDWLFVNICLRFNRFVNISKTDIWLFDPIGGTGIFERKVFFIQYLNAFTSPDGVVQWLSDHSSCCQRIVTSLNSRPLFIITFKSPITLAAFFHRNECQRFLIWAAGSSAVFLNPSYRTSWSTRLSSWTVQVAEAIRFDLRCQSKRFQVHRESSVLGFCTSFSWASLSWFGSVPAG
jgi:hypothetical protein